MHITQQWASSCTAYRFLSLFMPVCLLFVWNLAYVRAWTCISTQLIGLNFAKASILIFCSKHLVRLLRSRSLPLSSATGMRTTRCRQRSTKLVLMCSVIKTRKNFCHGIWCWSRFRKSMAPGNESMPVQLAPCWFAGLAISNAKIYIYFSNEIYGIKFIKQHSEAVMVWN